MFSLEELVSYISLDGIPSSWNNCYKDIEKKYSKDWLDDYNFDDIIKYYDFDEKFYERIKIELELLKTDDKLNILCFILYYILYFTDEATYYNLSTLKPSENTFKNHGSYMIPVISLLCGYKIHIDNMKKRGFDGEQIKLQKYNVKLSCTSDRIKYGVDGIRFSQMLWASYFIKGNIIQIGRLQYEVSNRKLDKLDIIKDNTSLIYIHIPSDKDLLEDDVNNSFKNASTYIKKYYKEINNSKLIFFTETWLLSPEIREILKPNNNIIKFQNKFNIIKYPENINDFLNFVFGDILYNIDYNNLCENTFLQKELKKRILKGDKLHLGLGILKDEFYKIR